MNVTKDIDAACIGTRLLNIQPITLKVSEIQNTFLCIAFNRRVAAGRCCLSPFINDVNQYCFPLLLAKQKQGGICRWQLISS